MVDVSIIVPVYNVEKYIRRCVESILNQTYTNFELILVDDGSSDNSGAVCDEYANNDNRIIVIHKENGGLSSARNRGIDIAVGKYIAFIDGDDYVAIDMIEKLHNAISINNADIAMCDLEYVDENGKTLNELNRNTPVETAIYSKNEYFRKLAGEKYWHYVIACNKLYKRKLFKEIRYPYGRYCEDNHIIDLLIEQCTIISSVGEALYFYVQRNGSITNGRNTDRCLDDAEAFLNRVQRAYLSNYECRELLIESSLKNAAKKLYLSVRYTGFKKNRQREKYKNLKVVFDKLVLDLLKNMDHLKTRMFFLLCVISVWNYGIYYKCRQLFLLNKRACIFRSSIIKFLITKFLHKGKVIVVFGTPYHKNIGDAALTLSEKIFLKKHFPKYGIFEFTERNFLSMKKEEREIIYKITQHEKILFQAGGSLGTLWMYMEEFAREIFESMPNADIIIMPQTIYYEDNEKGRKELEKSKKIYNSCTNLRICAREARTYELAQNAYGNTYLIPDMALYLSGCSGVDNNKRKGIYVCLRVDCEKTLLDIDEEKIYKFAKENFDSVNSIDMLADVKISKRKRKDIVKQQLFKFEKSELVITDRLHGMIFAAISGTPCIVVNSKSHKVKGCYEWIKSLGYIKFADNVDELQEVFDSMDISKKYTYDNTHLIPYYEKLADIIRGDKL